MSAGEKKSPELVLAAAQEEVLSKAVAAFSDPELMAVWRAEGWAVPVNGVRSTRPLSRPLDGAMLKEGDEVSFESVFDDRRGKYRAHNVTGGCQDDSPRSYGSYGSGSGGGGGGGGRDCM